ncbi:MAG: phosphatase PAP2 family protein [Pseudomonas sp.]
MASFLRISALLAGLALAACSTTPRTTAGSAHEGEAKASGYLAADAVPDSLALVPPPPAADSAGFALDEEVSRQALALRGSARFAQAARDADLSFPAGADHFACALGVPIDRARTPRLYTLLERSRIDASAATKAAKNHYRRPRPFMLNGQPTCTPQDEPGLRDNGSYPSGHTAIGWAWALILSEIDPAHADAIQARGRNYGESRLVCNVHWQSDILEGRVMGAATVARLHDDAAFRGDLAAARKEIATARAQGLKPARDCAAETETLRARPASAL